MKTTMTIALLVACAFGVTLAFVNWSGSTETEPGVEKSSALSRAFNWGRELASEAGAQKTLSVRSPSEHIRRGDPALDIEADQMSDTTPLERGAPTGDQQSSVGQLDQLQR